MVATWNVDTIRSYLPKNWGAACLTERDCLPLTVDVISRALLHFARPIRTCDVLNSRPTAAVCLAAPEPKPRSFAAPRTGGFRIGARPEVRNQVLLIEDDDAYRYVLARELRARGNVEVIEVRLATDAVGHLDRDPTIGKAVVDIHMPMNTLTGLAFARMMQHRNREARIVLMTGDPDCLDIEEAKRFGAVLFKEADAGALISGIHLRLGLATAPRRA
jgi:ActR/RegA family two-component response regulator